MIDTAEPMDDDCGTRPCQYMNGVYGNKETYSSNFIYSVSDFPQQIDPVEEEPLQGPGKITFDEALVNDMRTMDYAQFTHFYSTRYPYLYRTEKPEWQGIGYQLTDENYLQTWFYKEKQVDGQQRRRKLGKNACLRRLMFPWIEPNTLLFNLYIDRERFFDNSDGVITIDTLLRKVKLAMEMNQEQLLAFCNWEIKYWKEHRPKFIMQPGKNFNSGTISMVAKKIRWEELDDKYDRSLSFDENLENLNVSMSTLYRYCKEKWIDKHPGRKTKEQLREEKRQARKDEIEDFLNLYNPDLSLRKNIKAMEEAGLKMSTTRLTSWIEKYYEPKQEQVWPSIQFPAPPSFTIDPSQYEVPVCDWDIAEANEKEQQSYGFNWTPPTFDYLWS